MLVDENELQLLNELLDQMNDIDEEEKASIFNNYIIADPTSRTISLMTIKDRLDQKQENKNGILHI